MCAAAAKSNLVSEFYKESRSYRARRLLLLRAGARTLHTHAACAADALDFSQTKRRDATRHAQQQRRASEALACSSLRFVLLCVTLLFCRGDRLSYCANVISGCCCRCRLPFWYPISANNGAYSGNSVIQLIGIFKIQLAELGLTAVLSLVLSLRFYFLHLLPLFFMGISQSRHELDDAASLLCECVCVCAMRSVSRFLAIWFVLPLQSVGRSRRQRRRCCCCSAAAAATATATLAVAFARFAAVRAAVRYSALLTALLAAVAPFSS